VKRNPFRSERDAFRLFVLVGGATLVVVAVALIFGSRVGGALGVALLFFGLFHTGRWVLEAIAAPEEITDPDD